MRLKTLLAACVAAALVAVPAGAAIKAMSLQELMDITHDTIEGRIVAKDTIRIDRPFPGSVYTVLTLEGQSQRSGETVTTEVLFHGSHDPQDRYGISEMPNLQDVRLGGEVVAFIHRKKSLDDRPIVFDLSGVYRIERGFGEPVVIGKGEGLAIAENTKLSVVREQVRTVHLAQMAAKKSSSLDK